MEVAELARRLREPEPPGLIDVREDWELEKASVDGATHIPMGQIANRLGELDTGREYVVMCHSGVRSRQVALFLQHAGFGTVSNLSGGIEAWSTEIDPHVPRY